MSNIDWKKVSPYEGPWESPGFCFWQRFLTWQRQLNNSLKPLGLTHPHFCLLASVGWLTRETPYVSQQEIADFCQMERMHISQISRRLAQSGYLTRQTNPSDKRALNVQLTGTGADLLARALVIVEAENLRFFQSESV